MHQHIQCSSCHATLGNPNARNCMYCGALLALPPGMLIGNQYRVVRAIGEGGAGSLYLAEDTRTFDRRCVLKRLNVIHNASERTRFIAEVQILTQLRHPQIPQVFAFLEDGGQPYIVMEYVAGRDLAYNLSTLRPDGSLRPGRPRPLTQALNDGITICSILEHLHSRQPAIVHCDIKPANLIRDNESNALFLVDFGAAMSSGSGEVFGTPGYAAPEQYRSQRYPASDIYATAATIYHLLTDDDPANHPHQFPRLGHLPAPVSQMLEQCLHTEPQARPTATQFRELLERCLRLPNLPDTLSAPDGNPITSLAELASTAQLHWNWLSGAAIDGHLQTWLRENQHFELLHWFNQERIRQPLPTALRQLILRINPDLAPAEVRFSQQVLELDERNIDQPLNVLLTARNGSAEVRVQSVPVWLQIAPTSLQLQANTSASLHVALDGARAPRHAREDVVFEITTATGPPQRVTLRALTGAQQPNQVKPAFSVSGIGWLLLTWALLAATLVIFTLVAPAALPLLFPLLLGAFVGTMVGWFTHGSSTTIVYATLMAMLGAQVALIFGRNFAGLSTGINASMVAVSVIGAIIASTAGLWAVNVLKDLS